MPANLGNLLKQFKQVLIPELNTGQLRLLIRGQYLVDARGLNKIQGKPFLVEEIEQAIDLMLSGAFGDRQYMVPRYHHVRLEDQDYDLTTVNGQPATAGD
jgi:pyruvate/2-oxoacid:ferredoxin oxidoreductase alpha subunit